MKKSTDILYGRTRAKTYEGMVYIITCEEDQRQYLMLLRKKKNPEYQWKVPPFTQDPKHQVQISSAGDKTYVATTDQELHQVFDVTFGGKDEADYQWKVPPIQHTITYMQ